MYILDSSGKNIHNSDFIERYSISVKSDAVLVVGGYSTTQEGKTLGKYADEREARDALIDLFNALAAGAAHFIMPDSRLFHPEGHKQDARTKRRGGS